MNKKYYSVIGGVVFLVVLVIGFTLFSSDDKVDKWTLVPKNTLFAIEVNNLPSFWGENQSKESINFLQQFEVSEQTKSRLAQLDKILRKKEYTLADILGEKSGLASFHYIVDQEDLATIYYFPILSQDLSFVNALNEYVEVDSSFSLKEKQVENGVYWELKEEGKPSFYFLKHHQVFVGTSEQVLIENVLTQIQNPDEIIQNNLEKHLSKTNTNDQNNVFVNLPELSRVFASLATDDNKQLLASLELFSEHTFFEAELQQNNILLNGFTYAPKDWAYLNCFHDQTPQKFEGTNLFSNRTLSLSYFGVSDGTELKENLLSYWEERELMMKDKWEEAVGNSELEASFEEIYEHLQGVVAYAVLENKKTNQLEKVMYLPSQDIETFYTTFDNLAKATFLSSEPFDTEKYKDYVIAPINSTDFPYLLLGEYFAGFGKGYYAKVQNYIVIANTQKALKNILQDIESENTWNRSSLHTKDLSLLSESNVGLYLNPTKVLREIKNLVTPTASTFINRYEKVLSKLEVVSLQFATNGEEEYYTDWGLRVGDIGTNVQVTSNTETNSNTRVYQKKNWVQDLGKELITKPFVVINHETKQKEIFTQDKEHNVILISSSGKALWDYPVRNPIVGKVFQVDLYKNEKLQYLFATKEYIYCLDRRGRLVDNFPIKVPNDIQTLNVIDYSSSKKYRFLVSTNEPALRMYDKKGKNLRGWNPQEITGKLVEPTQHIRVKGKDVIFAVQQNGTIHVWSRSGRKYKDFPIVLGTTLKSPVFIAKGKKMKNSTFSVVNTDNTIFKYGFDAEKKFSKKMEGDEGSLQMILAPSQEEYALAVNKGGEQVFYDKYLKELFKIELKGTTLEKTQFYPLSKQKNLFVNYSKNKAFWTIQDKKNLIQKEFSATQNSSLLYSKSSKEYTVYRIDKTKVIKEVIR